MCLRIASPAISRVGKGGMPGPSCRPRRTLLDEPPRDRLRQLHQRVLHVDDLNRAVSGTDPARPLSRRSRGFIAYPSADHNGRREIPAAVPKGIANSICKEPGLQTSKTGNCDYLRAAIQTVPLAAWEFFTDDSFTLAHFGDCERRFHSMVSAHFI